MSIYIEFKHDFPCDYIEHLHKQEGEVTRNIGTLIANAAGRDKSEWKLGK